MKSSLSQLNITPEQLMENDPDGIIVLRNIIPQDVINRIQIQTKRLYGKPDKFGVRKKDYGIEGKSQRSVIIKKLEECRYPIEVLTNISEWVCDLVDIEYKGSYGERVLFYEKYDFIGRHPDGDSDSRTINIPLFNKNNFDSLYYLIKGEKIFPNAKPGDIVIAKQHLHHAVTKIEEGPEYGLLRANYVNFCINT